jgi:hypothetical protein
MKRELPSFVSLVFANYWELFQVVFSFMPMSCIFLCLQTSMAAL